MKINFMLHATQLYETGSRHQYLKYEKNKTKKRNYLPITPSCCGDNGLSCAAPGNEPDANESRSESATTEPPGDTDRADTLDPAKDNISVDNHTNQYHLIF